MSDEVIHVKKEANAMSSLFRQFKTDAMKEQEGVLVKYGENDDKTVPAFRLLRRNATNQRYAKSLERETAPYRRLIDLGTLDNKTAQKVFTRVFCTSVLIGWENVQDEEGKIIPFNIENAIMLMDKLPDLYEDLSQQSVKVALFRQDALEADAKN
jgi:hypothetical protein